MVARASPGDGKCRRVRSFMERPLCVDCISEKSGLAIADLKTLLTRIEGTVSVTCGTDRCRGCGHSTTVYSIAREA